MSPVPDDRTVPAAVVPEVAVEDEPIDLSGHNAWDGPVLVVFWALAGVVFLQFFTRYVLNDSLGWTEEIARFLLIVVTFLGGVMVVRRQTHIAVELLYRYIPRAARRTLQALIDVGSAVFFAALAWWCVQLSQRTFQMMVSIDVPKSWLYWFVAVCFALMAVIQVRAAWRHWRAGTSRLIDPDGPVTVPGATLAVPGAEA